MFLLLLSLLLSGTAHGSEVHGCGTNIAQIICAMDVEAFNKVSGMVQRTHLECKPISQSVVFALEDVFKQLPPLAQRMFCEVKQIVVLSGGDAYGGRLYFHYDSNVGVTVNKAGSQINYLTRDGYTLVLDEKTRFAQPMATAEAYLSRNLQEAFGQDVWAHGIDPLLPLIRKSGSESVLYRTVLHEIGHMFEQSNEVLHSREEPDKQLSCAVYKCSAWVALSWNILRPVWEPLGIDRTLRQRILKDQLSPQDVDVVLEFLRSGGFSSLYTLKDPYEDFAETFVYYFHPNDSIWVGDKKVVDFNSIDSTNPVLMAKIKAINDLMASPNLRFAPAPIRDYFF